MTEPTTETGRHEGPTSRDCPECQRLHDDADAEARAGLDVALLDVVAACVDHENYDTIATIARAALTRSEP
jgi:hypothetical protein